MMVREYIAPSFDNSNYNNWNNNSDDPSHLWHQIKNVVQTPALAEKFHL